MGNAKKRRDPFAGLTLAGKYEVLEPLARGGMGRVYRALQKPLGRAVALKILDTDQLEGQAAIEDFQKRFFLEAAAVAKLQHPNTVVVYDYGKTDDDDLFIAMELLEGENLHDTLKREKTLSARRAAHIALQVCGSIGGAHDQGMVHRDLKPSNIMLTPRGNDPDFVKVLDFGLVKQEDNGLTQSGALLGTPRYMAPEQITT
ncbi:MAG: serine/threonine-protein kinase [Myxococcota bacterium]